mmetsp:Transcript_95556/g.270317  ORF Transcript_95556/g.270317 Transcript_95556/m.270317 type:complete len:301 (-) Transcript_95556:283-1185(-)
MPHATQDLCNEQREEGRLLVAPGYALVDVVPKELTRLDVPIRRQQNCACGEFELKRAHVRPAFPYWTAVFIETCEAKTAGIHSRLGKLPSNVKLAPQYGHEGEKPAHAPPKRLRGPSVIRVHGCRRQSWCQSNEENEVHDGLEQSPKTRQQRRRGPQPRSLAVRPIKVHRHLRARSGEEGGRIQRISCKGQWARQCNERSGPLEIRQRLRCLAIRVVKRGANQLQGHDHLRTGVVRPALPPCHAACVADVKVQEVRKGPKKHSNASPAATASHGDPRENHGDEQVESAGPEKCHDQKATA